MSSQLHVVVIGNGMVGHHLLERSWPAAPEAVRVTVIGEEPRLAYDRVNLSKFFEGKSAADLALAAPSEYAAAGFDVQLGDAAVAIDRAARTVRTAAGRDDRLRHAGAGHRLVPVRAPGARAATARAASSTAPSTTSRRSRDYAAGRQRRRGGRRRAARASRRPTRCRNLGLETHVVEFAPRLMPLQVDDAGGGDPARAHRGARRGGAHRQGDHGDRRRTTAASRGLRFADGGDLRQSTWWCSRPASGPATSWRARRGLDGRRARRHRRRRALPHLRPRHLRHRRVRGPRRADLRPGGARLPDGRGGVADGCWAARTGAFTGADLQHQAQADGRRRGQLRRRLRPEAGRPHHQLRRPGRGHLQEAGGVGATSSACSAACSWATPRPTASCWPICQQRPDAAAAPRGPDHPAAGSAAERRPGWAWTPCPRTATICSCNNVTKGAICPAHRRATS